MSDATRFPKTAEWRRFLAMQGRYPGWACVRASAAIDELLAAAAERDKMLRLAFDELPDGGLVYSDEDYEMWLDGLQKRAREGTA